MVTKGRVDLPFMVLLSAILFTSKALWETHSYSRQMLLRCPYCLHPCRDMRTNCNATGGQNGHSPKGNGWKNVTLRWMTESSDRLFRRLNLRSSALIDGFSAIPESINGRSTRPSCASLYVKEAGINHPPTICLRNWLLQKPSALKKVEGFCVGMALFYCWRT